MLDSGAADKQVAIYKVIVEFNVIEGCAFKSQCINAEKYATWHHGGRKILGSDSWTCFKPF